MRRLKARRRRARNRGRRSRSRRRRRRRMERRRQQLRRRHRRMTAVMGALRPRRRRTSARVRETGTGRRNAQRDRWRTSHRFAQGSRSGPSEKEGPNILSYKMHDGKPILRTSYNVPCAALLRLVNLGDPNSCETRARCSHNPRDKRSSNQLLQKAIKMGLRVKAELKRPGFSNVMSDLRCL